MIFGDHFDMGAVELFDCLPDLIVCFVVDLWSYSLEIARRSCHVVFLTILRLSLST